MNELMDFEYLKFQYDKDLHDVFGTVLDTFPAMTGATVQGQIYLWELFQKIKYNLLDDIDVNTFLTHKYVNGRRNSVYDKIKKKLPAVCYNARFDGYKNLNNIKSKTNLMFLDVDDFNSKEEALAYKTMIIHKYDWILACNLSLSRLGLHIIIMVDKIYDNNDFNNKYDYINLYYFNNRLDSSSKSLTRYTVVPFDYDIYINENPKILDIENIMSNNKKGIRSVEGINSLSNKKGICSVESLNSSLSNNKGICSVERKKIICTAYTFSSKSPINEIMNDAARESNLRFNQGVDESLFKDPDIPLYYHDGIDVISINLFPYQHQKVLDGHRTVFIGAITIQMIYLNVELPEQVNPVIRENILKFILSINKKICKPPLPYNEVLNSYNANWKRYEAGKLDYSKYLKKQRSFWSVNTTLKGNEKRKITCKIKNEPIVAESKRRIEEAINSIHSQKKIIKQKDIPTISGLKLPTVKKYWKDYKEMVRQYNSSILNK